MSAPVLESPPNEDSPRRRRRRHISLPGFETGYSLLAQGESMVWLTGGALACCLAMIAGVLGLILFQALPTFWPLPVVRVGTFTDKSFAGEVTRIERYAPRESNLREELPEANVAEAMKQLADDKGRSRRRLLRTENFELSGEHFRWVSDFAVREESHPEWMLVLERLENGRFYGEPIGYLAGGERKTSSSEEAWTFYLDHRAESARTLNARRKLERVDIGRIDTQLEAKRLAMRSAELRYGVNSEQYREADRRLDEELVQAEKESERLRAEILALAQKNEQVGLVMKTADGKETVVKLEDIVRAYPANRLTFFDKVGVYFSRWWEFLSAEPRNVNTEGGVFPAIWGTVAMTLIMSLAVAPFGVLAALFLREYAKSGWVVGLIRIALNNLAGVPSIVFGVFGLGFFCYQVGAFIDGGPRYAKIPVMPPPIWFLTLGGLAVIAVGAFLLSLMGASARAAESSDRKVWMRRGAVTLWLTATIVLFTVAATNPFFNGFFNSSLPNPTFGKGGILWAALTLALLTLPVVIVATEEALAAVPNSMREGSYACGAGKWQTIKRIVLPQAMPGIMTGMILAMSRGAGEAAPLMLVGALKFAPKLPLDGEFPYVHADRPFMHLAYHIFDLAFQSPNAEAAKPTTYVTAMLLIVLVAVLNIAAVTLRTRLRKSYRPGQF